MSQINSKKKLPQINVLPLLSHKNIISLVILLLVTSSSTQTPSLPYICPTDCECNLQDFSARCENLDTLIGTYTRKSTSRWLMPIKSLDLSNNGLTKISNQLEVLVNLTELNLSHNKLSQVRKLNFQHLETLDLSYNHITSGKLSKLPRNIVSLNLAHNQITYLPIDFMKLKKLRTLDLHENPLNCTCETLHVRNWMSYQNVWSSKVIKCTAPQIVKGQPWLQARQNDICFESTTTMRGIKDKWDDIDGNDVMMGDQPQDDGENKEDEDYGEDIFSEQDKKEEKHLDAAPEKDEVDEDFIRVNPHHLESTSVEPIVDEDEDASGHSAVPIMMATKEKEEENEEDDDGSGSGGGILAFIPGRDSSESTSEAPSSTTDPDEAAGLVSSKDDSDNDEVTEIPILPGVQKGKTGDEKKDAELISDTTEKGESANLNKAAAEDNTGTYILLVIIGVLLVSLIIFVAMKNRKEKQQARRRYDVEKNAATELQDMDKRLLGKPVEKNGNGKHAEHSPLINDYKDDRPNELTTFRAPEITVDEPIQELANKDREKSQQSLYDMPNGNGGIHEPIEPVHASPHNGSIPRLPDSDEEVFHPASDTPIDPDSLNVSNDSPKRYSPVYPPVSPRSARYSPVYSPETGRVKIKLTETPKPKTPVVVTRSRSRAGDYVNTPNN